MKFIRLAVIFGAIGLLVPPPRCYSGGLPNDPVAHNWTDSTGRFHTVGTLIDGDESTVRLLKQTGSTITVPMSRLSAADQQFVRSRLKIAVGAGPRTPSSSGHAANDPVAFDRIELLSKAAAWLNEFKAMAPAATKAVSVSSAIDLSNDRPSLSQPAPQLPENMIYIRVSTAFLRRWMEKDVTRSEPVYDNILGTPIAGNSTTVSRTQFELQPNRQAAVGVLRLAGSTSCRTIGSAGPVQIFTTSTTQFQSAKTIWLDGQGIHFTPAVTNAQTHSETTGLATSLPRLRGRIALRIAGDRVAESHATAEAITADHVRQRVNRRFDASADETLTTAWKSLSTQIAALPVGDPLRPRAWQASSTSEGLQLVAIGAPGDGSGYVAAPLTDLGPADVRVDIHVEVARRVIGNATLKRALAPAVALLATMPRPEPAEGAMIDWSADRNWLSMSWDSTGSRQVPQDRTAATLKTAR